MTNEREAIRRIMISINKIDELYERVQRKTGVKGNTVWVLYALDDGKPHSQKQIYEEWLIPKTTLNTIVKELESDGYVRMEPISGQRREMNIYLTEAGKKYARQVLDSFYQAEEEAFGQVENAGMLSDTLENFCKKLGTAFDKLEFKTERYHL